MKLFNIREPKKSSQPRDVAASFVRLSQNTGKILMNQVSENRLYPRPNRRGLIEADLKTRLENARTALPAAQPPRPH